MEEPKIVKITLEEGEVKRLSDFVMKRDGVPDPNDPDLEPDQVLVYLGPGSRKPQNDYEKRLLKQIKEIEAKGHIVEIPFN